MCGPHFGCVKITENGRKYATESTIDQDVAMERGLADKAVEFPKKGREVYAKIRVEGVRRLGTTRPKGARSWSALDQMQAQKEQSLEGETSKCALGVASGGLAKRRER
jgi:hypothetical protein